VLAFLLFSLHNHNYTIFNAHVNHFQSNRAEFFQKSFQPYDLLVTGKWFEAIERSPLTSFYTTTYVSVQHLPKYHVLDGGAVELLFGTSEQKKPISMVQMLIGQGSSDVHKPATFA
jgi:hypothetical protein